MFQCLLVFLTLSVVFGAQNFSPGCSFFNGQCVYNVKLGHEQQCDVSTRSTNNNNQHSTGSNNNNAATTASSGTSSGFQACSCKDVENLNKNQDSLWKSLSQLQTDMTTLAHALNVSKDQLGLKDGQIGDLMSQNNNLTALLAKTCCSIKARFVTYQGRNMFFEKTVFKVSMIGCQGTVNLPLFHIHKNSSLHLNPNEETVLSAITTLMYLVTVDSKAEITCLPVVECMLRFSQSKNKRLSNLAQVFLEDYCSKDQINEAKNVQRTMMAQAQTLPT